MRTPLLSLVLLGALTTIAAAQQPGGYPDTQGGPPPGYQGGPPPSGEGAPPHAHHASKLRSRFDAANVTRDGRLTRDQAEHANFKTVVKHFDAIDTAHHGYITFEDLKAYHRANSHHHQTPPPAG